MAAPWPAEIRLRRGGAALHVAFDDGRSFELEAEYLRVMTGSAEDRGHGAGPRPPIPGKTDVRITAVNPVGRYAVRLVFSDGHDTGLYTWKYLRELAANYDANWSRYLARLHQIGYERKAVTPTE